MFYPHVNPIMAQNRGPEAIATVPNMIEAIAEVDKPVLTVGDIADQLGVAAETVRRRREELEAHPDVKTTQVGRARAYWIEETDTTSAPSPGSGTQTQSEDEDKGLLERLGFKTGALGQLKHGISIRAKHHPIHTRLIAAGILGYFISILGVMGTFALAPPNFTKFLGFFIMFGLLTFSMAVVPAAHLFYLRLTTLAQHATLLEQATDGVEQ